MLKLYINDTLVFFSGTVLGRFFLVFYFVISLFNNVLWFMAQVLVYSGLSIMLLKN